MSTLSLPSSHSTTADFIDAVCIGCSAAILIPAGSAVPRCTACQKSDAAAEAKRLLADARDLRDGTGIWSGLTAEERREQLQSLVLSTVKDDWKPEIKPIDESLRDFVGCLSDSTIDLLCDLVSRRISERTPSTGKVPAIVKCSVADLTDTALINLIGETDEPLLLAAASAELVSRLGVTDSYSLPIYIAPVDATPDAVTRFELEGKLERVPAPVRVPHDEHPLAGSFDHDFAA